jgi:hypothetical protein
MALSLNASATNLEPSILAASKVGTGNVGFKFVGLSPAVLNDFSCEFGVCLWGSASASPAPINMASWTQGPVVHTTNFVAGAGGPSTSGWGTLNMFVVPQ